MILFSTSFRTELPNSVSLQLLVIHDMALSMKYKKAALLIVTVTVTLTVFLKQSNLWQFHPPSPAALQSALAVVDSRHFSRKNANHSYAQHLVYPLFSLSGPISKDVIVHSVHFDDRARNGHNNVSMFLVGANRNIFDNNWIVGCAVENKSASEFTVRTTVEDYLMHANPSVQEYPFEEYIIECYDLPVVNGSQAFVMYKTANSSPVYVVASENPLFIPAPRIAPSGEHNITVVTCSKAHDKGVTWLPEFVRYQKTIGVDHVHVNIVDTFIKDGGLKTRLADPSLAQAVLEGFVSFTVWKDWYKPREMYLHSESLRKLDCVYRFRGTYDYAFVLDTDDFFNPQIPGMSNLKDYILKWCYSDFVGSCSFDWVYYFPGECGLKDELIDDGNVTRILYSYASQPVTAKKSLHLTSALIDESFHKATCKWCLMPGYKVVEVPLHIAYVAHLRMNAKPPTECK